jgi:nucleotide-binding universal stress UspA family protein
LEEAERHFTTAEQKETNTEVATDTDLAVKLFVRECAIHRVKSETYIVKAEPIQEVLYESRFADLLILDPTLNFYGETEPLPSHFTKELLARAECPVLLAPGKDIAFEEIVFCYDGSASAVYAMKQFTYLIPQLRRKKAVLLEVNKTDTEELTEEHRRILAWLKAHYYHIRYETLHGKAKKALLPYLFTKEDKIVVMGAYGRSFLSTFLKPSAADKIIQTMNLPVFVTHK